MTCKDFISSPSNSEFSLTKANTRYTSMQQLYYVQHNAGTIGQDCQLQLQTIAEIWTRHCLLRRSNLARGYQEQRITPATQHGTTPQNNLAEKGIIFTPSSASIQLARLVYSCSIVQFQIRLYKFNVRAYMGYNGLLIKVQKPQCMSLYLGLPQLLGCLGEHNCSY